MGKVATAAPILALKVELETDDHSNFQAAPGYAHEKKATGVGEPSHHSWTDGDYGGRGAFAFHEPIASATPKKMVLEPPQQSSLKQPSMGGGAKVQVWIEPNSGKKHQQNQQQRHQEEDGHLSSLSLPFWPLSSGHDKSLSRTASLAVSLVDLWTPALASAAALESPCMNHPTVVAESYSVGLDKNLDGGPLLVSGFGRALSLVHSVLSKINLGHKALEELGDKTHVGEENAVAGSSLAPISLDSATGGSRNSNASPRTPWMGSRVATDGVKGGPPASPSLDDDVISEADRDIMPSLPVGGVEGIREGGEENATQSSGTPASSVRRDSIRRTCTGAIKVDVSDEESTGYLAGLTELHGEASKLFSVGETGLISTPRVGCDNVLYDSTEGARQTLRRGGRLEQLPSNASNTRSSLGKDEIVAKNATVGEEPARASTPPQKTGEDNIVESRNSPFVTENSTVWKVAVAAHARAESLMEVFTASETSSNSETDTSADNKGPKKGFLDMLRSLRQMSGFQQRARIESAPVMPRPPQPRLISFPVESLGKSWSSLSNPLDYIQDGLEEKGIAPVFGGHGHLGNMNLVSPQGFDSSDTDPIDEDTASSATGRSSPGEARMRIEVEGSDVELGDAKSDMTRRAQGEANARTTKRVVSEEAVNRVLAAASEEETIVLPCAPTEEEKVMYYKSGRSLVVSCAVASFLALSAGTWLFTIIHPAFYWFGVPSAFLITYLGCHYFGVAVWGKDFSPEDHEEIIRASEQRGYQPAVDVFLPVCKEPAYLLANTWRHISALDYPDFSVYVLDDGDKEEVKALAEAFGFSYLVRPNRPSLKKAGNLRHAFAQTSADAIAIFDADFCPRPDFLKETIPYFGHDASIGIVQTPQYFRYRKEQTWIEQGAGITQEFFYRLVQVNQDKFNAAVCVGSCGLYRRAALDPFGGMAAIGHSEDMYTGFKMTEHGYKIKYVPLPLAMGTCPDEPQSFFMQQYRWAMGSATLVLEKDLWQSNISTIHKICFLNGLLYYVATALMLFLTPLPFLLLVWIDANEILWYNAAFILPAILFASLVMPLWCTQRYGMACHRVRILQCYAHLYAIKDRLMGRSAPWVPSGAGASRGASATFKSAMRLLVVWNVLTTMIVVGGCIYRMTELAWYHFVPAIAVTVGGFVLSISTLFS